MMEILTGEAAARIREAYIRRFVDTTAAYYITDIQRRTPCSDGMCYFGCLWGCFRKPRPMSREVLPICPTQRVTPDELLARMADLPEDIYIFDDTYSWTIALTHDTDAQERPYCLFTDA